MKISTCTFLGFWFWYTGCSIILQQLTMGSVWKGLQFEMGFIWNNAIPKHSPIPLYEIRGNAACRLRATVAANVDDDRQGQYGLFSLLGLFLVHHVGRRGGFMSRMKALQEASTPAATSEGLWLPSSTTPLLCFLLKYFAKDSPLLIFCSVFLPPCPGNMEWHIGSVQ